MNRFEEIIKEKSDEELITILKRSQEYQPEFVELVIKELKEVRNINSYNDLVDTVGYKHPIREGIFGHQTDCLGQPITSIPLEASSDSEPQDEEYIKQLYEFAHNLLFKEKRSREEVINALVNKGIESEDAEDVVDSFITSRKERASKDMLFGALWFIGGTIATVADLGYIFWGAIVFGVIQFFRGLINHS